MISSSYQPEENYFTHLTLGQTLVRIWDISKDSFYVQLFMRLSLMVMVPVTLLLMIVTTVIVSTMMKDLHVDHPESFLQRFFATLTITGVHMFLSMAATVVGDAAMARAVCEIYCRQHAAPPNWVVCLRVAVDRLYLLILANILIFCGVTAGILVFALLGIYFAPYVMAFLGVLVWFLPGLFLALSWFATTPILMVEHERTALSSLSRSWELAENNRLYILATIMTVYLANSLATWAINLAIGGSSHFLQFTAMGTLVQSIPKIIFFPIFSIMKTVLYINLRVFREGLTSDQLARELNTFTGASSTQSLLAGADHNIISMDYRQVPSVEGQAPGGDVV